MSPAGIFFCDTNRSSFFSKIFIFPAKKIKGPTKCKAPFYFCPNAFGGGLATRVESSVKGVTISPLLVKLEKDGWFLPQELGLETREALPMILQLTSENISACPRKSERLSQQFRALVPTIQSACPINSERLSQNEDRVLASSFAFFAAGNEQGSG